MPFETLSKIEGTGTAKALARASLAKAKLAVRSRLVVCVEPEVMQQIGTDKNSKFVVMVGTGSELGFIRLQRNNSAGIVQPRKPPKGETAVFNLGYVNGMPNRREKSTPCMVEVIDAVTIEVRLPKWLDRPVAAAPAAIAPRPPVSTYGRPVTSSVMGDPPAGRSALDSRKQARR